MSSPTQFIVPGPIAIALSTGRPELARIGIKVVADQLTQEQIDGLSGYAEALVREIQAERQIVGEMYEQLRGVTQQARGAINTFDRLEEAFRRMRNNEGPEAVREALRNPKRKED